MTQKKKILFIINPFSGANRSENKRQLIKDHLDHDLFDYSIEETQHKEHAIELASKGVVSGYDRIIACGGDGTVNEVGKALVGTEVALGIIPGGSGNGFAMHIGMGRNTIKAIKILNKAVPKRIDSCFVNGDFFLNLAGIGFDAVIAYKAENGEKRGLQMYAKLVSQEIWNFKPEQFKVSFNNEVIEGPFTSIAIANASMYGYNFRVAPQADLMDGMLDVVFIKKASLIRTLSSSWRMLNKSIDKSKLVSVARAKEVKIETLKPYYYHVDGEPYSFDSQLVFKINPLSIKVLFPS